MFGADLRTLIRRTGETPILRLGLVCLFVFLGACGRLDHHSDVDVRDEPADYTLPTIDASIPPDTLFIDWDNPLQDGVLLTPENEGIPGVVNYLRHYVVPRYLGIPRAPVKVFINDPTGEADSAAAWVYDDIDLGKFVVIEEVSQTNQAELESLATCPPDDSGCVSEGWSLVEIRDGVTALLIEGDVSNGVVWLEDELRFNVVGPSETFSSEDVIAVANAV